MRLSAARMPIVVTAIEDLQAVAALIDAAAEEHQVQGEEAAPQPDPAVAGTCHEPEAAPPAPVAPVESAMQRRPKPRSFFANWTDFGSDPPAAPPQAEVSRALLETTAAPDRPKTSERTAPTEPKRLPMPTGSGMLSWV